MELSRRAQLSHFGFGIVHAWDYIQRPRSLLAIVKSGRAKLGPRRVNVGRQETGGSGEEGSPAAATTVSASATGQTDDSESECKRTGLSWGGKDYGTE